MRDGSAAGEMRRDARSLDLTRPPEVLLAAELFSFVLLWHYSCHQHQLAELHDHREESSNLVPAICQSIWSYQNWKLPLVNLGGKSMIRHDLPL